MSDDNSAASELSAGLGAWTAVTEGLPEDETPVLLFMSGNIVIGELHWEYPGYEDTYQAFQYWDDPTDDGQAWEWNDITHWMPLPEAPNVEVRGSGAPANGQSADD